MDEEVLEQVKKCSDALRSCHGLLSEIIGQWESGEKIHPGTAEQAVYLRAKIRELFN